MQLALQASCFGLQVVDVHRFSSDLVISQATGRGYPDQLSLLPPRRLCLTVPSYCVEIVGNRLCSVYLYPSKALPYCFQ
ncbi:uncharacterized protein METZ01_LOCUS415176 [marine metagenome]|uniref:Uncharacterized protein n=1 Tax=marine metagenome TaxID=408172 RepID=A0A382WU40_9ZZZZ